jgi:hypothetical protein
VSALLVTTVTLSVHHVTPCIVVEYAACCLPLCLCPFVCACVCVPRVWAILHSCAVYAASRDQGYEDEENVAALDDEEQARLREEKMKRAAQARVPILSSARPPRPPPLTPRPPALRLVLD